MKEKADKDLHYKLIAFDESEIIENYEILSPCYREKVSLINYNILDIFEFFIKKMIHKISYLKKRNK